MFTASRLANILFIFTLVLSARIQAKQTPAEIKQLAEGYFQIYAERKDFQGFMALYAENVAFQDVLYQVNIKGKEQLTAFFDWPRGDFKVLDGLPVLTVNRQLVDGNVAVTEGVFNRFSFQGKTLGPWRFTIWQAFNEHGKIVTQQDWINYTPKTIDLGL